MTNDLCEISMLEILCFPIEYAQAVLWPSFVGDLIELVGIKWVGGGASNKPSERGGQHLWAGWASCNFKGPWNCPAVAPSMLRLATARFTSPYHPSNLHGVQKSMKKKSTFWKMVMKVAVVESGERLGNQAAPVKLSWPITAAPNCNPINTNKYKQILTNRCV